MTYVSSTHPLRMGVAEIGALMEIRRLEERVAELERELDDVNRKDLDETRRLLYAALAAGRTKKYTLVGTLTNALVHHSGLKTDPVEAVDTLVSIVENAGSNGTNWSSWVQEILVQINERLAVSDSD